MYKFKITVRKGCLKGLEFGKVCADFLKNYQIRTKKKHLEDSKSSIDFASSESSSLV